MAKIGFKFYISAVKIQEYPRSQIAKMHLNFNTLYYYPPPQYNQVLVARKTPKANG